MPLWLLKQTIPWEPTRPDAITNARVKQMVVRAPTEERARIVAGSFLIAGQAVSPGEAAPVMETPYLDEGATICEQLDPDGGEEVIVAQIDD